MLWIFGKVVIPKLSYELDKLENTEEKYNNGGELITMI